MIPNQSGRAVEALQDNLISTNLQLESKSQPPECLLALSALRWNICVAILASGWNFVSTKKLWHNCDGDKYQCLALSSPLITPDHPFVKTDHTSIKTDHTKVKTDFPSILLYWIYPWKGAPKRVVLRLINYFVVNSQLVDFMDKKNRMNIQQQLVMIKIYMAYIWWDVFAVQHVGVQSSNCKTHFSKSQSILVHITNCSER